MNRIVITAIAILAVAAPAAAAHAPSAKPAPAKIQTAQLDTTPSGFSTRVRVPGAAVSTVSSAACNRRTVGMSTSGGAMSVNGGTDSRTLVAVPIRGDDVASATTQRQITDVCNHN